MSLPIGHAAIGLTACSLFCRNGLSFDRWKVPLWVLILSNLPDVDVVLGIALLGNGSAFHRGPTHSLAFAIIGGFVAGKALEGWSLWPGVNFRICFILILFHVLADAVFTHSPTSLFWPVVVNWSRGHSGLKDVVDLVLFGSGQDATIIFGCALLILLHRTVKEFGTVILQK